MAITCKISSSYARRTIIVALACVVFGLWGVFDYVVATPAKQRDFDRYTMLEKSKDALESDPGAERFEAKLDAARRATYHELTTILEEATAEAGTPPIPELSDPSYSRWLALLLASTSEDVQLPESLKLGGGQAEAKRLAGAVGGDQELAQLRGTLITAVALEQPRQPGEPLTNLGLIASKTVTQLINAAGTPEQPSTFDRLAQSVFVLCLPMALYFVWRFMKARRRVYRLEEDGTLKFPDGRWLADDIADIDMSDWLAKSVAWLVHRDGSRLKLDDYLYQDLFKIVGALAIRFYPEEWSERAKRVQRDEDEKGESGGEPRPAAS